MRPLNAFSDQVFVDLHNVYLCLAGHQNNSHPIALTGGFGGSSSGIFETCNASFSVLSFS